MTPQTSAFSFASDHLVDGSPVQAHQELPALMMVAQIGVQDGNKWAVSPPLPADYPVGLPTYPSVEYLWKVKDEAQQATLASLPPPATSDVPFSMEEYIGL